MQITQIWQKLTLSLSLLHADHADMAKVIVNVKEKTIGTMNDRLYITSATSVGNLTVLLRFSDSTTQTINVGEYIRRHPHPQYNKYLDPRRFNRFTIENGNIVWGKNWDIMFPIEDLHAGKI